MTDSEFLEKRAIELFAKFSHFIPEEYRPTILNDIILAMLKSHIDVAQNMVEIEEDDDDDEEDEIL